MPSDLDLCLLEEARRERERRAMVRELLRLGALAGLWAAWVAAIFLVVWGLS